MDVISYYSLMRNTSVGNFKNYSVLSLQVTALAVLAVLTVLLYGFISSITLKVELFRDFSSKEIRDSLPGEPSRLNIDTIWQSLPIVDNVARKPYEVMSSRMRNQFHGGWIHINWILLPFFLFFHLILPVCFEVSTSTVLLYTGRRYTDIHGYSSTVLDD